MNKAVQHAYSTFSGQHYAELIKLWRLHLGGAPPEHLPKSVFAKVLAYRLQSQELGCLSKAAVKLLDQIAADLKAGREPAYPSVSDRHLKPGTIVMREHDQVLHRVMVLQDGFAWNGQTFASLSAVAKAITGTSWNGRRFFGLMPQQKLSKEVTS